MKILLGAENKEKNEVEAGRKILSEYRRFT